MLTVSRMQRRISCCCQTRLDKSRLMEALNIDRSDAAALKIG